MNDNPIVKVKYIPKIQLYKIEEIEEEISQENLKPMSEKRTGYEAKRHDSDDDNTDNSDDSNSPQASIVNEEENKIQITSTRKERKKIEGSFKPAR